MPPSPPFRTGPFRTGPRPTGVEALRQHLRQVSAVGAGQLLELGAAGEAVGEDGRTGRGLPYGGQQLFLRAGHRHVVVPAFEAEVAREAAAAAAQRPAASAIRRSIPPKMSPCTGYSAYQ